MKYLKTYKLFESVFVSQKDVDELLDKINKSGITSLNDIDKNRLTLFSEGDKEIIETIEKMANITNQFKIINKEIRRCQDSGESDGFHLMDDWMKLNKQLVPLEQLFRKWGIELGDERLWNLMNKQRPDAYGSVLESKSEPTSKLKFTKQPKKKGAKTDVYNVSKGGSVIGQVKWSSRMRGYAFLPTQDCDVEIKEFVKELMRKRREQK